MSGKEQKQFEKAWKPFLINISLIIALCFIGILVGFSIRTNQIFEDQFVKTAQSHFKNIVLTRRWSANYGGVFVKKTKGMISNPYLDNPDIETRDGTIYTKKNPALMTREISEYAEQEDGYKFHITSLKPLNPNNLVDEFEKQALLDFENGTKESVTILNRDDNYQFRYMAPLVVEKNCLQCHKKQGYNLGDIRGGISVNFDITHIKKEMSSNVFLIVILTVLITALLLKVIYFLVGKLSRQLSEAYSTIAHLSITDALTQIYNRGHFEEKLDEELERTKRYNHCMGLILLDIDFFKCKYSG